MVTKLAKEEVLACANGDGPIDQGRVKFVVDAELDAVSSQILSINDRHEMSAGSFMYVLGKGEGWRQLYRSVNLPWPLRQRDLVYTEHTTREQGGGE